MNAIIMTRELLLNKILGALNELPVETLASVGNQVLPDDHVAVISGDLFLIKMTDVKSWADSNLKFIDDADECPAYPVSYDYDGEYSDIGFEDEQKASIYAFTEHVIKTGELNLSSELQLPKAKHVIDVSVQDPDTRLPVELTLFKSEESGGMFAIDTSYLLTLGDDDPIVDPISGMWTQTFGD